MNITEDGYINIKDIAEAEGVTTRAIRLRMSKPDNLYDFREIKVNGGISYEIKYSSLEPDVQELIYKNNRKSTALVPLNYKPVNFQSDNARATALARMDIISALLKNRKKFSTKKEADNYFIGLYNSGKFLPKIYKFIGSVSLGTVHRWLKAYEQAESAEALVPGYKYSKQKEYNTKLSPEMISVLMSFVLDENKLKIQTAVKYTKDVLEKRGIENLPCDLTFKRYVKFFRKNFYDLWTYSREGRKAFQDKVEHYIKRDISVLNVGDVLIADGHVLNFQVINPFTGKPTRATLVGFLDWKSSALVGYEIMMTENTQCIASALRNSILNLGMIPKVVYQDNGKAFKAKYFQNTDFEEEGFNGVYANLGIRSVFANPYNARAKKIERFFRDFQEWFERLMPSFIGTTIEDKPARLKRGEKLHLEMHNKLRGNWIPTVEETIKLIDEWLIKFYNEHPCPNDSSKTIQECLNSVQKQNIPVQKLNDLMMKTEIRTINKHGITLFNMHYRCDEIFGLRDKVYVRYSLFDLSKIYVYSQKGEFLCVADRVRGSHPMAALLGNPQDVEEFRQSYRKQQRTLKRVEKEVKQLRSLGTVQLLPIETQEQIEQIEKPKVKRERKKTPREQQMNRPQFNENYERFEWYKKYGCTNSEDRIWISNYKQSSEYKELYGD